MVAIGNIATNVKNNRSLPMRLVDSALSCCRKYKTNLKLKNNEYRYTPNPAIATNGC